MEFLLQVGWRDYGKWAIPMLSVDRRGDKHTIRETDVSVRFEGDFEVQVGW